MERRSRRARAPKPVRKGEEYVVDISEVSRRGNGIARIEGFVVFVPNTSPGDRVMIRITKVLRRCAVGRVVEVAAE